MEIVKATNIVEFTQAVVNIVTGWDPDFRCVEIWYRGVCDSSHALLPGAYWRKDCDENSLVLSFRNAVPSYIQREPLDEFEWYYLMQHYGLPTRLLDWTESPLAALYFALADLRKAKSPCVWVMDPIQLNKIAHGKEHEAIIVPLASTPGSDTSYWLPTYCGRDKPAHSFEKGARFRDNTKPLAIYPKRYNPRIVAQRGVFTLHGKDETPIEELFEEAADIQRLARIDIPPQHSEDLLDELWVFGLNKTARFPEPHSVADDLRRAYGVDDAC